jgi:hypothetical protein
MVAETEGAAWLLFTRPVETRDDASAFKLIADGFVINKANYWFMLNEDAQVLVGKDIKVMKANRPELYKALRRYLLLDEEQPASEEDGDD